jgi:hypothetical protein
MAYTRSRTGGTPSKFFKCKRCYSANRFCTHQRGKVGKSTYGKRSFGRTTGYGTKRKAYAKKAYVKRVPEPTKIDVPVLDGQKNTVPDMVPMNGVRVRCTRLTDPTPVQYESKKFGGTVCWRGVTDAFNYEMNGDGPFLHRRIIFQGPQSLGFDDVKLVQKDAPCSKWSRSVASTLDQSNTAGELRKMFGTSATIRDILFSPVKAHGFNVVSDTRKQLEGKSSGTRKFQKYFKGFGKTGRGVVVKYNMAEDGSTEGEVADEEKYYHVYAMDIFQYGINGLDQRLPGAPRIGSKRGCDSDIGGSDMKRQKSDSSYEDVNMSGLHIGDDRKVDENALGGVVRIVSNMKLYWYDPK